MHILHIVTGLSRANGVSVFLCELAAEQVRMGHDVSILIKNLRKEHYPLDERVKLVSSSEFEVCSRSFAEYDVVHVHAMWDPWLTNVANAAKIAGCKVVWSPHGMLTPWALKNKWWKKIVGLTLYQYWSLKRADLLHATAQSEVEDIRRLGLKNPVVVAPLGVRVGDKALRGNTETGGTEKILLFVSRVQKKKGLPNLLDAWAKLPKDIKQGWVIRIVGPDQDNHTAELREQVDRLDIAGEVRFVGPKYGDELDAEYRAANLFVLPTHSENFGSVVIEALAHNVPVICTKGAPWSELETYKCGWWIDIGVKPLVEALTEACDVEGLRALPEMGRRGRKLVEEKYTWQAVTKKLLETYELR